MQNNYTLLVTTHNPSVVNIQTLNDVAKKEQETYLVLSSILIDKLLQNFQYFDHRSVQQYLENNKLEVHFDSDDN